MNREILLRNEKERKRKPVSTSRLSLTGSNKGCHILGSKSYINLLNAKYLIIYISK